MRRRRSWLLAFSWSIKHFFPRQLLGMERNSAEGKVRQRVRRYDFPVISTPASQLSPAGDRRLLDTWRDDSHSTVPSFPVPSHPLSQVFRLKPHSTPPTKRRCSKVTSIELATRPAMQYPRLSGLTCVMHSGVWGGRDVLLQPNLMCLVLFDVCLGFVVLFILYFFTSFSFLFSLTLSIDLSICLSIYLSIYLSIWWKGGMEIQAERGLLLYYITFPHFVFFRKNFFFLKKTQYQNVKNIIVLLFQLGFPYHISISSSPTLTLSIYLFSYLFLI